MLIHPFIFFLRLFIFERVREPKQGEGHRGKEKHTP